MSTADDPAPRPKFITELKRRRVVRVAVVYGATAFAVLQAADILVPALHLPAWMLTSIVLLLALGLPIALVVAWAFQLTPEGVQRTGSLEEAARAVPHRTEPWLSLRTVALATAMLMLGAAAAWLLKPGASGAESRDATTLAVLPFMNLGAAADLYFADGMSEAVRGKLAGLEGITVIASSSTRAYRDSPKSPRDIGRELGARYLLTGTVLWAKSPDGTSRVQVNPELINAESGTTRWQQPFDAVLSDVFAVQGEIAGRVADALRVTLREPQREQLATRPTTNLDAYDAYLRAESWLQQAELGATTRRQAAVELRRAVDLDPRFALAWARLCYASMGAYWYGEDRTEPRLRIARAAADTALALQPDLPEAHIADGYYWYWGFRDYARALPSFERALALDDNSAAALTGLASVVRRQGRWTDAVAYLRRAVALDPRSALWHRELAITLLMTGELAAADSASSRGITLAPEPVGSYVFRARILYAMERVAEAEAALREALRINGAEVAAIDFANRQWVKWIPFTDSATWRFLEHIAPTSQVVDTGSFHVMRAEWLRLAGQTARAAALGDSARPFLEQRVRDGGEEWWYRAQLAMAHALAGDARTADAAMRDALAVFSRVPDALDRQTADYIAARVALTTGDHDAALTHLASALATRSQISRAVVRHDLRFAPLRGNARYEELVRPR